MNEYKLLRCNDEDSLLKMHEIREKVLFSSGNYNRHHPDDLNPDHHCFIFLLNETVVGTVRLDFLNLQEAAVRLVAILPEYQGRKIGSKMLNAIEAYATKHGALKLVTNAATNAKKFYEAIGFISEDWIDPGEGISQPTISMIKHLEGFELTSYTQLNLISERIKLIPIDSKYAIDIYTNFTAEITRYMWPSAPKSKEEINKHILLKQKQMKNKEEIALLIIKKESSEFLGYISIHQINSKTPELGIWLKKSAHGFHYGCEALNILKNWAEHHLHYDYLKYPVDKKNIASRKLAEKLGGRIEDAYIKISESGNELDEVEYRFYRNK